MKRRVLGALGERLAASHLRRRGYRILDRNWRSPAGEVDIVAQHDGDYVFVEVKTRRGRAFGSPEEAVTSRKVERLCAVAEAWLADHVGDAAVNWRIEVVAVELDHDGHVVRVDVVPFV
ncbi:MAG: YraN family protein [Ardenticatenia bacterium]|nr:YraN family protein [Ardenticatenia bacterium]